MGASAAYVPPTVLRHLAASPAAPLRIVDATMVLADISGFTRLSERLARRGRREGAEELAETIGATFSALLDVAYANGGALVKQGGDALVLLFEGDGHLERACDSALGMREALRAAGPLETSAGEVALRMSQGVHSGEFHLFLVGESHRELVVTGPATSAVVTMENAANAGDILLSPSTAERLPEACLGSAKGPGVLLAAAPAVGPAPMDDLDGAVPDEDIAGCLSTAIRAHVASGPPPPEHRNVTIAFVRFEGTDDLIAQDGPDAAARAIEELVTIVQRAADEQEVCFLDSDVDADGGKFILTAGAPRIVGDDDERLLLALRRVVEAQPRLPLRIGVNSGSVFCGDLGPSFQRKYTVMGDAVNLAARLVAKAPPGTICVTGAPLQRSPTRFTLTDLEPFTVKGKRRAVHAWLAGPAIGSRAREKVPERFPLVGRERELGALGDALASVRAGTGRLVEIVGEPGIGKTRLLEELRARAPELRRFHATCEAYTATTPYVAWRELLRQLIDVPGDARDELVLERLRAAVRKADPTLVPWEPLLAIAVDVAAPPTPEVEALADEFRVARLHEVVVAFLRRALTEPTMLEFRDGHLMDHASAALLRAVAHAATDAPWLVAVTLRDTGTGFSAARASGVVRLELAPLGPAEALALAEAVTDEAPLPPHILKLAAERSGGSPQFLRDLLRAAEADGGAGALPASMEAAAMGRLDLLSPADHALICRAAVLGVSFEPQLLAEVLEPGTRPPDERTWARLWRYFERAPDGHMNFIRPYVREAAYTSLPFGTRRALHAAVGEHLERDAAEQADEHAAILSLHFARAGDHGKAWRYARMAADRASDRFAYADAAGLYHRALDAARTLDIAPDERAVVWEGLGSAREHTGELAGASEAFTHARRLVADDPVRSAELMHHHARVEFRAGRIVPAVRWTRRGLRILEGVEGPEAAGCRAHLGATLATLRQRQGRMEEAIALCRGAIAEAEAAGAEAALAHACFILDWALVESGQARDAVHSERALDIYAKLGQLDRQATVLNNMGGFAYRDGRWDEAVGLYQHGAQLSFRAGDVGSSAFGDCNVAEVLADQGRLEEAEVLLWRARRTWRATGHEWGVASADALLGRVAVRDGRHDEGIELLRQAYLAFKDLHASDDVTWVEALSAEAYAMSGRPEAALNSADLLLAGLPSGARLTALLHRVRGFAFAQLGDLVSAEEELEASLAAARAQEDAYEIAVTLDALQHIASRTGRSEPPARGSERDSLLYKLEVIALPEAPLAPHGSRDGIAQPL
ncbi:MAG TPA: adenylate/guanylate cyclase domain-containing protein [Solirubrobacteraceae bacterium]|nr:adenylate/guanylate cyclase domain-containing protein [Solirubrobacteraceae bacterium]